MIFSLKEMRRNMIKAKTFKDGDRIVFVIENCDEETKKKLFEILQPDVVADLEVKPTSFLELIADADLKQLEAQTLNSTTDKVFKKVSQLQIKGVLPESERDVKSILNQYIGRRFANQDASELANRFNDGHCQTFVDTFDVALDKVWKETGLSKDQFGSYPLDDKRSFIAKSISFFIAIGKKMGY